MSDGKIIIGTEINTSGIDKGIQNIEKKLEKLYKKASQPYELDGATVSGEFNLDEKELKYMQRLETSLAQLKVQKESIIQSSSIESQIIEEQKQKTNELIDSLQQQYNLDDKTTNKLKEQTSEVIRITSKISSLKILYDDIMKSDILDEDDIKQAEQFKKEIIQLSSEYKKLTGYKLNVKGITDTTKEMPKISNFITEITKKTIKWGLAVFGIRSIYSGIRRAISTISQYDSQLATDIQYIQYALAMSIKPIVEWLVNAVKTILQYINYIWNAWFGKPLFKDASAQNFANGLKKANSEAKKLQKTLTSFDEMEILQDNTSNTAESINTPSFDLGSVNNIEIPKWIQWIADNKEKVFNFLKQAAILIGAIKLTKLIGGLKDAIGLITNSGGLIASLGTAGAVAAGIIITTIIAKKVWDEMEQLRKELKEIGEIGSKGQKEWIKNEEDLDTLINTGNVNRSAGYELLKKSGGVWNWLNGLGKVNLENAQKTAENIGLQIDKEIELAQKTGATKEQTEKIKENIIEQYQYNSLLIQKLQEAGKETSSIEELNRHLIKNYQDIGGNVEEIASGLGDINLIKFDDKKMMIDVDANTTNAERKTNNWLNGLWNSAKSIFGTAFRTAHPTLGIFSGMFGFAKGGIIYPNLPKLASGGIINMPGRGVPLAGAYGGERGAEGVIPLTDSQQMSLLGEAIGKYITINANITNTMNGRVISRELQKVQNDSDFAYNR